MRRSISVILSACFSIVFSFLTAGDVFAQNDQGDSTELTSSQTEGTTTYVSGLTPGRAKSLVGGVLGLLSLIIGWRTKVHAKSNTNGARTWPIAALVSGLAAVVFSVVHVTESAGGFGTGGGKAGAIVAIVLGLTGAALSSLAIRSRQR
ncbi:MAG: DUF6223 family protein [Chryseolinea sp.]